MPERACKEGAMYGGNGTLGSVEGLPPGESTCLVSRCSAGVSSESMTSLVQMKPPQAKILLFQ